MTYSQFLKILMNYKKYNEAIDAAYDVGIDLVEGKFATCGYVEDMLEVYITSHYGEGGWDWVGWFIWENDYGQKGLEAYDENKNLICQSYEQLYSYLEENHKINVIKLERKDKKGNDVYRGNMVKHIDTNNICMIVYEDDCHYALDTLENTYFKLFDMGEPLFEVVK